MPIRFRCAYCNQLLGIARRKAGMVVHCPTCSGQVVVPQMDEEPASEASGGEAPPENAPAAAPGAMFEGSEIDKMLERSEQPSVIPTVGAGPVMPPVAVAVGTAPPAPASESGQLRPAGVWLSQQRVTMLSILAVVAMAVAFGAGLLVGMFIQSVRS